MPYEYHQLSSDEEDGFDAGVEWAREYAEPRELRSVLGAKCPVHMLDTLADCDYDVSELLGTSEVTEPLVIGFAAGVRAVVEDNWVNGIRQAT